MVSEVFVYWFGTREASVYVGASPAGYSPPFASPGLCSPLSWPVVCCVFFYPFSSDGLILAKEKKCEHFSSHEQKMSNMCYQNLNLNHYPLRMEEIEWEPLLQCCLHHHHLCKDLWSLYLGVCIFLELWMNTFFFKHILFFCNWQWYCNRNISS